MLSLFKRWFTQYWRRHKYSDVSHSPASFFEADFDSTWYTQTYPDVADAGMDPWAHFVSKGLAEGRLPCNSRAAVLDFRLWGGLEELALSELHALSEGRDNRGEPVSQEERARAAWALERWYDCKGNQDTAQIQPIPYDEQGRAEPGDFAQLREGVIKSGLFNRNWYLAQNEDVLFSTMDPFDHFWETGDVEGRDPGPGFSTSGYRYRYGLADDTPALAHYLCEGRDGGCAPLPEISGAVDQHAGGVTFLVCGHQAGRQIFGAERSLLDLLDGFQRVGVNVVVTLPCAVNASYIEAVLARSQKLVILPYSWWKAGRDGCAATITEFRNLLRKHNTRALYTNTSVLDEPLAAARAEGVPAVMHVRELPQWDESLCRVLQASPGEWLERIKASADMHVVNSTTSARAIGQQDSIVVPNIVNLQAFQNARARRQADETCVTVALISSNLPKKGLADFLSLAQRLAERAPYIQCVIFGPDNTHIQSLKEEISSGRVSGNIRLAGYTATPDIALAQSDIIVNLSHFQESFGRTVLEAMAAEKPVVAYEWGALPELIENGNTGFLVPIGDIDKVAECVIALSEDRELRQSMGEAGYQTAARRYGLEALSDRLGGVVRKVEAIDTGEASGS